MISKIKKILFEQLSQGTSHEKLARSVSLGIVMGCCPIFGIATAIAAFFTHILKLNHVVVQAVNYTMYPIQIPLIPVYMKVVSWLTDVGFVPLRPDRIIDEFNANPGLFTRKYLLVALYAVVIWLVLCLVLYPVLFRIFETLILRLRFSRKVNRDNQSNISE